MLSAHVFWVDVCSDTVFGHVFGHVRRQACACRHVLFWISGALDEHVHTTSTYRPVDRHLTDRLLTECWLDCRPTVD